MQHGKVYQNPELSLTQLAKQLQTNPSVVSRVINQGFQLNFNDFTNQYRISAIMQKFKEGSQKNKHSWLLLIIAVLTVRQPLTWHLKNNRGNL